MRLYFILVITAVIMAFITGHNALFFERSYKFTESDIIKIEHLKEEFELVSKKLTIIDIGSIFPSSKKAKLYAPIYNIIDDEYWPLTKNDLLRPNCENIYWEPKSTLSFKELLWDEYLCGYKKKLPSNFFKIPPYLHPNGRSYVYQASLLNKRPFKTKMWLKNNLPLFHILELSKIKKRLGALPFWAEILSSLNNDTLKMIKKGSRYVPTNKFFLVKNTPYFNNILLNLYEEFNLEYSVYNLNDFKNFLKQTPYTISVNHKNMNCNYRDGRICWQYNLKHLFKIANKSTIVFFSISILIIILVIWILLSRIKAQRREEEKRRLALQVLTHEFRTPISSMLLLIELITKKFSTFDEETQDSFLRLSDEIYRLQRLTESSRNYLKAKNSKKLLLLKNEKIESINQYINYLLQNYNKKIDFNPLVSDTSIVCDPYWLGICVKNIIDNAITHGSPPYMVSLEITGHILKIIIKDHGTCEFSKLEEITSEFTKSSKSQGTGLGLAIVKKVFEDMGGKLIFKTSPTEFVLVLNIKNSGPSNGLSAKLRKKHDKNNVSRR